MPNTLRLSVHLFQLIQFVKVVRFSLWPILYELGIDITFAHHSFKWRNLATHNAVVTVIILGISRKKISDRKLFQIDQYGKQIEQQFSLIGPYLIPNTKVIVEGRTTPLSNITPMQLGNEPYDGGNLILERGEASILALSEEEKQIWS